jgi:hypothetical protein
MPKYIRLKKFAPMGSAVTFPVQSIVYACVAVSAILFSTNRKVTSQTIEKAASLVSVFGDDILLPTTALSSLVSLLSYLGLKVNTDKTYGTGQFRESCGIDAFAGVDVTPVYLLNPDTRVPLAKASSQLEVANNHWRAGLWNASKYIEATIDGNSNIPVVGPRHTAVGLISFCGIDLCRLRRRWDRWLQVETYRGLRIISKVDSAWTCGSFRMFQWFNEKPQPDTKWVSGVRKTPVVTVRPGWVTLPDMFAQLTT